jgi:phospholipid/cholesterol/gamma-HCH transport system substrate-binding protein
LSRRTEIQVGATVLVALGFTLWGVTWLKEVSFNRKYRVWQVTFPQTGGLSTSDEVQVNGLRKGNVSGVALVGDHVLVDLALSSDVTLTSESRVAIRNIGLMGEKVIFVEMHPGGRAYTAQDTIPGIYEEGIPEVMAGMGATVAAITDLATQLKKVADVMDKDGNLDQTMTNFRKTSEDLSQAVSENRAVLKQTLANLNAASRTARALTTDREAELKQTLDSFERSAVSMERLTARLDSLRASLQSASNKIDRGDGTLGKLINDPRLYDDAKESMTQFRLLIEDIRKNPKKYVNVKVF